ncbi:hypothetical protein [Mucilaginibacter sp. UYCu711]|uniref:hypothetical protein n=1 Tax=Mucilaginibacter sp. UYCu711 TaxID=3156339 RepID=UPI003D1A52F8
MHKAEKDMRDFYRSHSPDELEAEIARDERSLKRHFYSIRQKQLQEQIESRINILKAMLHEKLTAGTNS